MKNIYSIRDNLAGEFAPPFIANNDAVAIRIFAITLKGEPERQDFDLHGIGSMDEFAGCIYPEVTQEDIKFDCPRLVFSGKNLEDLLNNQKKDETNA